MNEPGRAKSLDQPRGNTPSAQMTALRKPGR